MDSFLERLENIGSCKDMLRQSCKKNGLNTSLAGQMSISKLRLLNQKFKKAYSIQKSSIKASWIENELKTFNWVLIALSVFENALITDFSQKHWILLQNIFEHKTRNFIKFQTRRFLQEKNAKNKNWNDQQNDLLMKIVIQMQKNGQTDKEQHQSSEEKRDIEEAIHNSKATQNNKSTKDKIHWNEVARRLFEESNEKYFRSSKHCRQRWFNYIDPSKQRGKWRKQQDESLLELVDSHGKKWSQIAAILHRTEHNVKNRYHSLQGKGKKQTKLKKNNKNASIQEHIVKQQMKEQIQKEPLITYSDLSQKIQKHIQIFKVAQQIDCMDQIQNYQQIVRTEDASINPKNEFYIYSPFPSYSPKNLTPFIGSNSPSPFTFSLYNVGSFVTQQHKFINSQTSDSFQNMHGIFNNDKQ